MGFTKQENSVEQEKPAKEKHAPNDFEPSTPEQIKQYGKRARKAERAAKQERHKRTEERSGKDKLPRLSGEALRTALVNRKPFKIYRSNLFDDFIEACKSLDIKRPRYHEYLEQRKADARFCFDIASALSRMSWQRLNDMVRIGVTTSDRPHGLATRSWSEAFHFAETMLHLSLGAVEKKGSMRLTDLNVLNDWPVDTRKRPMKEDQMSDIEEKNAAMKAKARDDDEDDDAEEEGGKEKDEDEEDDEDEGRASKKGKGFSKKKKGSEDTDEDEDEDEDEKPARKKGKGKKSVKEEDDEESDESDDDEGDDGDEEEEKPRKKKRGSKSEANVRPSRRGKKAVADDEDEEADVKKDKKGKKDKADKKAKGGKAEKRERPEKVKFEDKTTVSKIGNREKGGPKTKLLGMIPKKGITVKQLSAAAGEEGIKSSKVKSFLKSLHKYGYVKAE